MHHFCTYFDRNYLVQGLTLYRSLEQHCGTFALWVLCLDDETYDLISRIQKRNLHPISLSDLEQDDSELLLAKQNRSRIEYIFTCTPSWPLFLIQRHPEIEMVTYLDADILFYSSPSPAIDELGDGSILIVEHRFPESLQWMTKFGIYNVGLVAFRNDERGRECLHWWRKRCLEWCYDRPEGGRFADQKYLDDWPQRFQGVVVLQHKGAGLAPWNWMRYRIDLDGIQPRVDGDALIYYHFHGMKFLTSKWIDTGLSPYSRMPVKVRKWLYHGYVECIRGTDQWLTDQLVTTRSFVFSRIRSRQYHPGVFLLRMIQGHLDYVPDRGRRSSIYNVK